MLFNGKSSTFRACWLRNTRSLSLLNFHPSRQWPAWVRARRARERVASSKLRRWWKARKEERRGKKKPWNCSRSTKLVKRIERESCFGAYFCRMPEKAGSASKPERNDEQIQSEARRETSEATKIDLSKSSCSVLTEKLSARWIYDWAGP